MNSQHAIQIYKNHIKMLDGMIQGVKEDIDHFIKDALTFVEQTQHDEEVGALSDLEDQLNNL
jgi:hypothetical protein